MPVRRYKTNFEQRCGSSGTEGTQQGPSSKWSFEFDVRV